MGCRECVIDGTIEHARVTAGGSSYGSDGNYNVAISGDGASGQLQVTVASGAITAVTVNAVGSGYSVASIDNSLLQTATSSSGTGARLILLSVLKMDMGQTQ